MAVPPKHYETPHGSLQGESILLFFTMQQSTGFKQFKLYRVKHSPMKFRGKTSRSKHSSSSETSNNYWKNNWTNNYWKLMEHLALISPQILFFVITWLWWVILSESISIFSSQLSRTGKFFATSFSLLLQLFTGTASPASKPSSLLCYCSALSMNSGWPCCAQSSSEQKGLQLHFSLCTPCAALKESANPNYNSVTFYIQFPMILFLAFTGANNYFN